MTEAGKEEVKRGVRWWSLRLLLFFGPFCLAGLLIFILYVSLDWYIFKIVGGGWTAYFFPPLGKESVIPVGVNTLHIAYNVDAFKSVLLIAGVVAFTDIDVGLFLLWNFDLVKSVPLLGKWLVKLEEAGQKRFEKSPWMNRLALVGVALFVMFPFQGSGGVGATILGRALGINKYKVWVAIVVGAIAGSFLIALISLYAGIYIISLMKQGAEAGIIIIAIISIDYLIYKYLVKDKWPRKSENEKSDNDEQTE